MHSLTIKRVPDDLLEELRKSADANQRSLNSEVLYRLKKSTKVAPISAESPVAEIKAFNAANPLPPLDEDFLALARSVRRS